MWIFTRKGFLSIVQHNDKSDILIVRSRFKGHIERIFGDLVKVQKDTGTDYEYRIEIQKEKVAEVMAGLIDNIDYGNFKDELNNQVKANQLDRTYVQRCWDTYKAVSDSLSKNYWIG